MAHITGEFGGQRLAFTKIGPGSFSFEGNYSAGFSIVEVAFQGCEVKVAERSLESGLIKGQFAGVALTASFFANGSATRVDIVGASRVVDLYGVCEKKVAQIEQRLLDLTASGTQIVTPQPVDNCEGATATTAPAYEARTGPSYIARAITGLCLSIGGFFSVVAGVAGIIMCATALVGMSTSNNKSGKAAAVAGAWIGFITVVAWAVIRLS